MKSFATHSPGNDPSSMFRLYSHGSARFLACTGKSIPSESDRCLQQSNFRLTPIKTSKYYYDQKLTFMIPRPYQTPFIVCPQDCLMNTERTINPGKVRYCALWLSMRPFWKWSETQEQAHNLCFQTRTAQLLHYLSRSGERERAVVAARLESACEQAQAKTHSCCNERSHLEAKRSCPLKGSGKRL